LTGAHTPRFADDAEDTACDVDVRSQSQIDEIEEYAQNRGDE
jgi:hypothetical protein